MKPPLIILAGPTAVGKTKTSISLAKEIGGEIISADSMQVYRYMDIGSAKISREEMEDVPHHLIDILKPTESFHVARFQTLAKKAAKKIYEKGRIPIVTGGTGFYIQALLYDVDFTETEKDDGLRRELCFFAKRFGENKLHEKLSLVDAEAANMLHPHNVRRVIRALEFYYQTGTKISEHNKREQNRSSPYAFHYFVLNDKRERLYRQIDKRVDKMMEDGLVEEVRNLKEMGCTRDTPSMKGLGYREILSYLSGEISLENAVFLIKRNTRHFAKRQLTWFKREKEAVWIDKALYDYEERKIRRAMLSYMEGVSCTKDYLGGQGFLKK